MRLEGLVRDNVPGSRHDHRATPAAAADSAAAAAAIERATSGASSRRSDERTRTSDQIATDLRRVLVGIPGVDDHDARLGRQPAAHARCSAAATDSRLAVEIRGEDLNEAQRIAHRRARGPQGHARASPIRSSAARKAGRSWRFASIGPRRRCSA